MRMRTSVRYCVLRPRWNGFTAALVTSPTTDSSWPTSGAAHLGEFSRLDVATGEVAQQFPHRGDAEALLDELSLGERPKTLATGESGVIETIHSTLTSRG